jgi:bla regulator protein BlaR1
MENILGYLLRVAVAIAVFYGTYYFFIRRDKDFVFNRFYLVGSLLIAFLIPALTISKTEYLSEAQVYAKEGLQAVDVGPSKTVFGATGAFDLVTILMIFYLLGFTYHLVKLLYGYYVAAEIKSGAQEAQFHGMKIGVSPQNIRAFTFFDRIVVGKRICPPPLSGDDPRP